MVLLEVENKELETAHNSEIRAGAPYVKEFLISLVLIAAWGGRGYCGRNVSHPVQQGSQDVQQGAQAAPPVVC